MTQSAQISIGIWTNIMLILWLWPADTEFLQLVIIFLNETAKKNNYFS